MAAEAERASERLLVVEDDPSLGPLVMRLLAAAGFQVTLATDLDSAVAAAQEQDLDLVLSDLVLGVHDGHDVADALRAIKPHIRIIFMSGYGASRYGRDPGDPVLAKPFDASELLARVERELRRTDAS